MLDRPVVAEVPGWYNHSVAHPKTYGKGCKSSVHQPVILFHSSKCVVFIVTCVLVTHNDCL